ncbi:MAG: tetratricopeptide repeat protein [Deltaproteobacteria bacterium]|nr:tetratricopeptide repeat protein [Deltaproteobacteria bacterium]
MTPRLIVLAALLGAGLPACGRRTPTNTVAPTTAVSATARQRFDAGVGKLDAGANEYDDAIAQFKAAIALEPKLWEAWLDIGVIELRRARLGEAAKALEASLAIYASPEALDALGEVYLRQNKAKQALALYERALREHPDDLRVRNALAVTLRRVGRLDEAEAECRAILGEHAFDPAAYATLGAIKIDRGQLDPRAATARQGPRPPSGASAAADQPRLGRGQAR